MRKTMYWFINSYEHREKKNLKMKTNDPNI